MFCDVMVTSSSQCGYGVSSWAGLSSMASGPGMGWGLSLPASHVAASCEVT